MITFADVAGSYDVSGRLEGSVSPSPSVDVLFRYKLYYVNYECLQSF